MKASALLLRFMSLLVLTSGLQHASAQGTQQDVSRTQEDSQSPSNFWTIEPWPRDIQVQFPGTGIRRRLKNATELPDQTLIHIGSSQKQLKLSHSGGHSTTISGPGIYSLDEAYLWKISRQQRTALDILPSNLVQEDPKQEGSRFENFLAFFTPRVPFAEPVPARIKGPDDKATQPIRPLYPPPVHFIETDSLPVQIGLEWMVESGQVDPHSVYLWSESHFVNAPNAVVRGGRGVISLSKYGRYYWQVEDASQRFLSAPRTIIVVRPGGSPDDDSDDEKPLESEKKRNDELEKFIGGMQLSLPRHRSHFFACSVSSQKQVSVPVQLNVQRGEFTELSVNVVPNQSAEPISIKIDEGRSRIVAHLNFKRTGSFELQPFLHSKKLNRKIPLSLVQMQISDICNDLSGRFSLGRIEALFEDSGKFPIQGSLNFLPLATERLR